MKEINHRMKEELIKPYMVYHMQRLQIKEIIDGWKTKGTKITQM